jgi:hypothetical protein
VFLLLQRWKPVGLSFSIAISVQLFHILVPAVCHSVGHLLGAPVAVGGGGRGAPLALIAELKLVQMKEINYTNMLNPGANGAFCSPSYPGS